MRSLLRASVFAVLLVAVLPALAADEWRLIEEHWYELLLDEVKAGWMSEAVHDDGQRYRTITDSRVTMERMGQPVRVEMRLETFETHQGAMVEMISTEKMSAQTTITRWRFTDEGIEQVVTRGGRETVSRLPLPEGVWLSPHASTQFARERRAAQAKRFSYRTLSMEHGTTPIDVESERGEPSTYPLEGRDIPVSVWITSSNVMPTDATEYYSRDGHLVFQSIPTGVGRMITRISSRETAMKPGALGGPELMAKSMVRPSRPIENVHRLSRATFRLRAKEGDLPDLPDAASQRCSVEAASTLLTVDVDQPMAADPQSLDDASNLAGSSLINVDDPLVRKLARSATRRSAEDELARAEAMRSYVFRRITKKDLQTAFASAAETARTRQGDCSEHAVLLCAMLRAQGIPARVATGLVYLDQVLGADGAFGWHMWTQALIDGKWIDLDATMPSGYHAGHVLTAVSTLADGAGGAELNTVLLMMGNLEIEVVDLGYGHGP